MTARFLMLRARLAYLAGAGEKQAAEAHVTSGLDALERVHGPFKAGVAGADAGDHQCAAVAAERVLQDAGELAVAIAAARVSL